VAAFQFLWEGVFLPLAEGTLKGCLEAIEALKPALCVVDQQNLAGALACELTHTPWLTSSTTSVGVINALEGLPQAEAWLQARLNESLTRLNLPQLIGQSLSELTLSQRGVMVFSSERLSATLQPKGSFPAHYHFIGPALKGVRATIDFPWSRLIKGRHKVFMSLGTLNAERGARLYREALEAFADDAYQLCLVAPPELLPPKHTWPSHLITASRLPQLELLAHMSVVITHAGHNTTCESLAHGLPLLALPIKDDQPLVAEQVKRVGAGLRLPFGRVKAAKMRQAVDRLINEPQFKEAACLVQQEFKVLGDGGEGAARLILAELQQV
jgi:MGT family glycosyltransferase